jgi:hypothetical protein
MKVKNLSQHLFFGKNKNGFGKGRDWKFVHQTPGLRAYSLKGVGIIRFGISDRGFEGLKSIICDTPNYWKRE